MFRMFRFRHQGIINAPRICRRYNTQPEIANIVKHAVTNGRSGQNYTFKKTPSWIFIGFGAVGVLSSYVLYHKQNGSKEIFFPFWFHTNIFGKSKYEFPQSIKYFDDDFTIEDLKQLEERNIQFKVLEILSSNSSIKQIFNLPINVSSSSDFHIWVENKYPTMSGVMLPQMTWRVKLIKIIEFVDDFLVALGLKLNRLDLKIKESEFDSVQNINRRDYNIMFKGKFVVSDKYNAHKGFLEYGGTIDFNHLLVNKGVKICSMNLIKSDQEKVNYKIL